MRAAGAEAPAQEAPPGPGHVAGEFSQPASPDATQGWAVDTTGPCVQLEINAMTESFAELFEQAEAKLIKLKPGSIVTGLVVEIRSDGTRTVARGALEDLSTGQQVALEARGGSPAELSAKLLKGMLASPVLAGAALKRAIGQRGRDLRERLWRRLLPDKQR